MKEKLHYSPIEWRAYRDNLVDDDKREEMQCHLLECDECMEIYLSLMESLEEEAQESLVPEGFSERVMEIIHEENKYGPIMRKSAKPRLITYYVSAACVTLFLVSSGVFTSMLKVFSKFNTQISTVSSRTESIFTSGWTDKLVYKTSEVLNISERK